LTFARIHRHEQQLVAAPEERGAQYRFDASQRDHGWPPLNHQGHEAGETNARGQGRDGPADSKTMGESAGFGLRDEGQDLQHAVERREETQQVRPCPQRGRLRFEQKVDDCRSGRRQHDRGRDGPHVRCVKEDAKSRRRAFGPVEAGEQYRCPFQHNESTGTEQMQRREQQEDGVELHHARQTFSGEAAEHSPCGTRRRDAAVCRSGPLRVETLRDQRPETRQQQRGDAGEVQIDDNDDDPAGAEIHPLDGMSHRADGKSGRHDDERRESAKKAGEDRNERDAERCSRKDHEGERGGGPRGEKGGVAEGL